VEKGPILFIPSSKLVISSVKTLQTLVNHMTIQIFCCMDCYKRKLKLKYVMQSTPFNPTGRIKRGFARHRMLQQKWLPLDKYTSVCDESHNKGKLKY
jgi:hypothetical protein